ncbi:MAG TPA: class I SAM-dependent methyltransferase [Myxococcota bacterium]|nr:class I SAM-dependent methyltransferase [Myxococcota bacterium]
MTSRGYVPALGFDVLTRFYDPLIALTLRENKLKRRLIDQAAIAPRHDVLDVGCGTGTLAMLAKRQHPDARVVGLDGDPAVLAIARKKIEAAGLAIELREGLADTSAVFAPASFDRILTSLVLHHLLAEQKRQALAAMRSWLRPGGELHVLDFGPQRGVMRVVSRGIAWFDGEDRLRDNLAGRLPALMHDAGFVSADERGNAFTPFGYVSYYAAKRT